MRRGDELVFGRQQLSGDLHGLLAVTGWGKNAAGHGRLLWGRFVRWAIVTTARSAPQAQSGKKPGLPLHGSSIRLRQYHLRAHVTRSRCQKTNFSNTAL